MVAHQQREARAEPVTRGEHGDAVFLFPVRVVREVEHDISRRLPLDGCAHAVGLVSEHDLEPFDAGRARRLDRSNDEWSPEHRLEELRFARRIAKPIAVARGKHERLVDGGVYGQGPC